MQHLPAGPMPLAVLVPLQATPRLALPQHRGSPGMLGHTRQRGKALGGSRIPGEALGKRVVPRRATPALCHGYRCRRAGKGGTSLIFSPASASLAEPQRGKVTVLPSQQEGPSRFSLLLLVPAFKFFPNKFS